MQDEDHINFLEPLLEKLGCSHTIVLLDLQTNDDDYEHSGFKEYSA